MFNIKNRSFTKLLDFSPKEINYLLDLGASLKEQKYNGIYNPLLKGKSVALIFEKSSTRTRSAFEVGAFDLGMKTVYLGPTGSQFGTKESVEDTARVLGGMFDGIEFRGFKQADVETLAKHSGVPVWNGLTDEFHPTQMIADFMTIQEVKGKNLQNIKMVFVGDGRNNMANSLMICSAKLGIHFTILAPKSLWPEASLVKQANAIAQETGAKISLEDDKTIAMKNADVIYTDVWVSMGETDWDSRLSQLHQYQVNMEMVKLAKADVMFLHCLPAFHNRNTIISAKMSTKYGQKYPAVKNGEFEVTDEVFQSKHSKVFQQAENRLHSIKAIMLATIGQ